MRIALFVPLAGLNIAVASAHIITGEPYDAASGAGIQLAVSGLFLMYAFRRV